KISREASPRAASLAREKSRPASADRRGFAFQIREAASHLPSHQFFRAHPWMRGTREKLAHHRDTRGKMLTMRLSLDTRGRARHRTSAASARCSDEGDFIAASAIVMV